MIRPPDPDAGPRKQIPIKQKKEVATILLRSNQEKVAPVN